MERTKKSKEGVYKHGAFQQEILHFVTCYCKLGANTEQLAEFFKVSKGTIEYWFKTQPEFRQAVDDGKMVADAKVQQTLYERACGFEYIETQEYDGIDTKGLPYSYTKKITKRVLGDVTAQIFWLTNRMRGVWQHVHRSEVNVNANVNITEKKEIDLTGLNDQEKEWLKKIGIKQLSKLSGATNN